MKYLYALSILSVLMGTQFVHSQDYPDYMNNINIGDWEVTIQERSTMGMESYSGMNHPPIFERKRIDGEPNIPLLKYHGDIFDDPTLKSLIDYTNLMVDHYNRDQLEELDKVLTGKWDAEKSGLKYRYAKYKPQSYITYVKEKDSEKTIPGFIMMSSGIRISPPSGPEPEIEDFGTGDRIGYMSILFVVIVGGKVQSAGGYFPLISEEYCCLLSRNAGDGYTYYTLSYKDWPEEGYDQPTPFYVWDRDGKVRSRETKSLKFEDYDIMTFMSGKPSLRGH